MTHFLIALALLLECKCECKYEYEYEYEIRFNVKFMSSYTVFDVQKKKILLQQY